MPSTGGGSFGEFARPRAPERRGGDFAVPRGGSEGDYVGPRGGGINRAPARGTTALSGGVDDVDQRRGVPAYSRPRDGRTPIGEAVERRNAPPLPDGGNNIIVYPYDPFFGYGYGPRGYYGYSPWFGGYGFGLGYFYDPFGYYGYYSPYNDYYGYSSGYSYGRSSYGRHNVGNLRLKVKPQHGQVYVDGYFAGEVDSFDGVFQRLTLEAGAHRVEIRAEGFEPVTFEVMVTPGETVTYKGELKPIR